MPNSKFFCWLYLINFDFELSLLFNELMCSIFMGWGIFCALVDYPSTGQQMVLSSVGSRSSVSESTDAICLLNYLCPSLPVEHRPSTPPPPPPTPQPPIAVCSRLLLSFRTSCFSCFSSASVSCLQLLRGQPLFLFPCGFQVRAWHVVLDAGFLRVCPIQPHFLRSICLATGSCPARSHRSSFRIFSCHWIL